MRKNLSILKPHIYNAIMDNEVMEKVSYLDIPLRIDLKADVKMGAVQFVELDKLIEKENEPKYIVISTDNLEQGYLAVTYLAAGFNKKHGIDDLESNEEIDEVQSNISEWEESPMRIPLIEDYELQQSMCRGNDNDIFAMNGSFIQGNRNRIFHTPYWLNCTNDSVCIVAKNSTFGFGGPFACNDSFLLGLNHFQGNDKVYLLYMNSCLQHGNDHYNEEDQEDDYFGEFAVESSRSTWNNIILSYSADEVSVYLKKETEKKYYKLLFQGNFVVKSITAKKGFSYEQLVNLIVAMKEENKCQLIENIVKYAVKDWKSADERPIENKDFDFMDRFCRAYRNNSKGKEKRKRTSKERMLQELIGMEDVKEQVLNVVNVMKYNRIRAKMGISGATYHNVHVMLGAPGTAKTTIAQLMGQIMVEEHLLPDNRFTCVNGAELKGMYVGHSAPKTKALFENNDIIVIDEAYSLVADRGESDSFSKEAIAQLIIELENHSTDKLVVFAGYGGKKVNEKNNKMKDFLDANPGIKSRITSTIYFDSYSPDEMVQIFFKIAENNRYHVDESVREMLHAYFQRRILDDNFGNGREARSLLETAVVHTANRVMVENKKNYSKAEMQTIRYEDVEKAVKQSEFANHVQNVHQIPREIGFVAEWRTIHHV